MAAVCVSGDGPCLVLCDEALRPLRPAILYGVDTSASAEIEMLTEEFGCRRDPGAGRHVAVEPGGRAEVGMGAAPRTRSLCARDALVRSNSYIATKLTGEYVMDHHTASQ